MDLDDKLPANRLFEILGRDGALQLHFPSTKFPIHCVVVAQTLIFLSGMGNGILNRNQTTWENTDTRLIPQAFYEPTHNQKIPIREMWWWWRGGSLNDSMDRLCNMGELKHEEGMEDAILELKSLIRGQRMGSNPADRPEITGSLAGRIAKTLIYGNRRKSDTGLGIGKIKKALTDFAKQSKSETMERKQYKERKKFDEIEEIGNSGK